MEHKVRLLVLAARTRRLVRHHRSPVERALALVIIARAFADHAAAEAAGPTRGGMIELAGIETVLAATLEHLQTVRRDTYHPRP